MAISPTLWKPIGIKALELNADKAVRTGGNVLVIAGPGAGKTELLAQRACFLLQTEACPPPRRILAISFKRDAARNLRDRVVQRCGSVLAARFDSYTFDSFCKNLVDRFLMSIPEAFRPTSPYRILDGKAFNESKILDFVLQIPASVLKLGTNDRNSLNGKKTYRTGLIRTLPIGSWATPTSNEQVAGIALWHYLIHGSPSAVTFPMLALISDLMLRGNPLVLAALRSTYQYVFLDEFQDTSGVHYQLTRTAFKGSSTAVTAVGDNKQRIMLWAGALSNAFEIYVEDFKAKIIPLAKNHRSLAKLVAIQSVIAKAIDPNSPTVVAVGTEAEGEGECRALAFSDYKQEALYLAKSIAAWIKAGLNPRHICILTRMRPADYTAALQSSLLALDVPSRIENDVQDLLSEPLTEALLDMLKITVRNRDIEAWSRTVNLLCDLSGENEDHRVKKLVDGLLKSIANLHNATMNCAANADQVRELLVDAMSCLGESRFRAFFPQYLDDAWYETQLNSLAALLLAAILNHSWPEAIDIVEGKDSVPIMTTHKSKGLEYHTVIFVGLEDGAHFSFQKNPTEEQCGFFVALSRAKERVFFTFSGARPTGKNGSMKSQSRDAITTMYKLLEDAGVSVETVEA